MKNGGLFQHIPEIYVCYENALSPVFKNINKRQRSRIFSAKVNNNIFWMIYSHFLFSQSYIITFTRKVSRTRILNQKGNLLNVLHMLELLYFYMSSASFFRRRPYHDIEYKRGGR